jgi:hypothetical protein
MNAVFLGCHLLVATSVAFDGDVRRDGTKSFEELGRDWKLPKGRLEDDPREVSRSYIVVEVADGSLPSSTLLGRTLDGNLRRCLKLDLLTLHNKHMTLEVDAHNKQVHNG